MKAQNIALLFILFINGIGFSQDMITYKNGTEVKAKVLEVNSSEVKFRKMDNPDGPLYTALKSELFMIKYENGTTELFSSETKPQPVSEKRISEKKSPDYPRVRYNGPRVGFTSIGPGTTRQWLSERGRSSTIIQFGWQFETQLFTLDNGTSGLLEWIVLAGGTEQGMFLPSATMLFGIRGKGGLEFGIGPNFSFTGPGMAIAVGGSIKSGKMYFPINLGIVPSVNRQDSVTGSGPTGVRVSLLIGFNTRR